MHFRQRFSDTRIVSANAKPLPGLSLEGYRDLEARVIGDTPGWTVQLRPPLLALPAVTLGEDGPDEAGILAEKTVIWAGQRIDLPMILSGPEQQTQALARRLRDAGIEIAQVEEGTGEQIVIRWAPVPQ